VPGGRRVHAVAQRPSRRPPCQDLRRYAAAAVGTSGAQALRSRRIELLGDEARRLDARRSGLLRRLLAPPLVPSVGVESGTALERFATQLVRPLQRTGAGWEQLAFAVADDLIAMKPGDPRPFAPPAAGSHCPAADGETERTPSRGIA
jgi:hypothetical protein